MKEHLHCFRCADTIESTDNNPKELCDECLSVS